MKKLNCPSCGETLEVESNNEYALCRKCKKRYNLKDDLNIKRDDKQEKLENEIVPKPRRRTSLVFIVVFITIFTIIIATVFLMMQSKRTSQEGYNYSEVI